MSWLLALFDPIPLSPVHQLFGIICGKRSSNLLNQVWYQLDMRASFCLWSTLKKATLVGHSATDRRTIDRLTREVQTMQKTLQDHTMIVSRQDNFPTRSCITRNQWWSIISPASLLRGNWLSILSSNANKLKSCWISPIPRSHQVDGCFIFFRGKPGDSSSRKVLDFVLPALFQSDISYGTRLVLLPSHVRSISKMMLFFAKSSLQVWGRSHQILAATAWQCHLIRKPFSLVCAGLCIADRGA